MADRPPIRFGLMTLQTAPYRGLVERWTRAEALGFDSIWVADHTPAQIPQLISFDAWTLLGAAAAATQRVRLGTLVTPISLRHPYMLALAVSTVDHISGGRVELGMGIGGSPRDEAAVGRRRGTAAERVAELSEQLGTVRALLSGASVDSGGHYYACRGAIASPLQSPAPPIIVAGNRKRLIALAVRHGDAWNTLGGQPVASQAPRKSDETACAEVRKQIQLLEDACINQHRDTYSLRRQLLAYRVNAFESKDRFDDYVGRFHEAGIDEFVFYWPSDPDTFELWPELEPVLERVAAESMPKLRSDSALLGRGR